MEFVDVETLAAELLGRPEWMRDALCLEHPDVSWFPELGGSSRAAKAICARCLVRAECLDFASRGGIRDGIWGGTSGLDR